MNKQRSKRWLAAVLLLASVAGCASGRGENYERSKDLDGTAVNVQDAKSESQARETEIVDLIPTQLVVSTRQSPKGAILSCDGSTYRWSGASGVDVSEEFSAPQFLTSVVEHFSGQAGFEAERDVSAWGSPRVIVRGPGDARYVVRPMPEKSTVHVSSYSSCFVLTGDEGATGEY
jgi:hypothetical protein